MQRVGSYIFLQCIITWNPKGNFYWEHEGRRIDDDSHEAKGHSTSDKYVHSMHKVDSHSWSAGLFVYHFDISDGGLYRCHGSNEYGKKHGSIEVAGKGFGKANSNTKGTKVILNRFYRQHIERSTRSTDPTCCKECPRVREAT